MTNAQSTPGIIIRKKRKFTGEVRHLEHVGRITGFSLGVLITVLLANMATHTVKDTAVHADIFDIVPFCLMGGITVAALFASLLIHRQNRNKTLKVRNLIRKLDNAQHQNRMAEGLFSATGLRLAVWQGMNAEPEFSGTLPDKCNIPQAKEQFLAFDSWMMPQSAALIHSAVHELRQNGKAFDCNAETTANRFLHVSGRVCGHQAILCFQDTTELVTECNHHKNEADKLKKQLQTMHNLLDNLNQPVWQRTPDGDIAWSNHAYRKAAGPDETHELFGAATREKIFESHRSDSAFHGKATAVIDGDRRILDVTDVTGPAGSAGIAADQTENEHLRSELKRIIQGYSETFDQLSTAVAIFDPAMKLEFFNQAFASLWPLETPFLESHPSHTLILDRLRERGILNEQPDWRKWKEELFEAYRALTPQLHIWNLPDGRTLRVVANPHPQGGVTWLYENLTEKLNLEARYNTLIRMQGETLDNLSEGVVVFGANGQVRLSNPAFSRLWSLTPEFGVEGTHISKIEAFCLPLAQSAAWKEISAFVTGFADKRDCTTGRMDLLNGDVLDYALVPLPQGQTMLTFVNVTDSVTVARALHERNEALEFADQLRNDFVQHVSYELRTPLTNIIGFTDLLRTPDCGSLNTRQHDYLKYIAAESATLLNIVNDILDLATVDAGIMELNIGKVNITEAMHYAIARIEDRLSEKGIRMEQNITPGLDNFHADGARVRQVLVNLLSNAANFAPVNSSVRFTAHANGENIVFCVHDEGCGISDDILDTIFKRFTTYARPGHKPGAGLGLSIVKSFVELHQGTVDIDTGPDKGTTVICRFPANAPASRAL